MPDKYPTKHKRRRRIWDHQAHILEQILVAGDVDTVLRKALMLAGYEILWAETLIGALAMHEHNMIYPIIVTGDIEPSDELVVERIHEESVVIEIGPAHDDDDVVETARRIAARVVQRREQYVVKDSS